MAKINLTPEELEKLAEALNSGIEPSPDLLPKLFPSTAEKFDVVKLDRAKIPTLEYAGKRSKAAILAEASAGIGAAPLQVVRSFGEADTGEWQNMIVQGDNLQFLKTAYNNTDPVIKDKVKGKVKLVYIDPPFATKSDFGGNEGEKSYTDKIETSEFLEGIRERLIYLRELLSPSGTIYVHLDTKMAHYIKVALDEIFQKNNFRNELVWCYTAASNVSLDFPNKHDTIFRYTKTEEYIFNKDDIRVPYAEGSIDRATRNVVGRASMNFDAIVLNKNGKVPEDWWTDIQRAARYPGENVGYPTQKSEKLLERIILASSNPGDLIMDIFAGSGTTAAVAEKLDRRWIVADFGKHAIYTMQKRMLRIGESKSLLDATDESGKVVVKKGEAYGKHAKPFGVISAGAYDFSHVMDLRKHRDAYINFVLGLFQATRDDAKMSRYKAANIYGQKNGSPVEVFPVWDDTYLKEIKIDEDYLQGIIEQLGGRLEGEYYIITPESCANVGDTTLKNQNGKDVHFKIRSFPYKILEDISRKLELEEQPSSADNINNLITSTAFYFNEDVEISAVRTDEGLKITEFKTKILNKEGRRFPGLEGLAMLLIDLNHEADKPFDMDVAIYAKEIKEDGIVKIDNLTQQVGIIAIDKHGNESKVFTLE